MGSTGSRTSARGRELPLVLFSLEGHRCALPLPAVLRVFPMVEISPLPKAPPVVLGAINLHGKAVPVLDIRRRFRFPPREYGLSAHLLIAQTTRRVVALPVDEALGVTALAAEAVSPQGTVLPGIGHWGNIVTLPDGLLFIQNLDAFLSLDEEKQLEDALEGQGR